VQLYLTKDLKFLEQKSTKQIARRSLLSQLSGRNGASGAEENEEIEELATKLEALDLPKEARAITARELKKLK
jgi:ATP-dependent Lon protease